MTKTSTHGESRVSGPKCLSCVLPRVSQWQSDFNTSLLGRKVRLYHGTLYGLSLGPHTDKAVSLLTLGSWYGNGPHNQYIYQVGPEDILSGNIQLLY